MKRLCFRLFGYADRVDVVVLPDHLQQQLVNEGVLSEEEHNEPFPLHEAPRAAQRLVVIRDLKTVRGPDAATAGLRHMRCLFEDLQLALYARAWEVLHPNDRVVGVGASEVGESTTHYVELDSDLAHVSEGLLVGDVTDVFSQHFPASTQTGATTTPFRRWMAERLTVAQRAVSTAAQGHVHPRRVRTSCSCTVAHSCDVSDYTGGDF